MYSYSKFEHKWTKSYMKFEEPISEEFRVWVNGEEIPVYTCRISKYPFNRIWPGYQRHYNQSEGASFINLVGDEELVLEVETTNHYERLLIKPYSKNVCYKESEGKISFSLKEHGGYVLECDSYHHSLYIFYSKPIPAPKKEEVTYYFDAGIHFPGKITLKSNESVYIDKDALVYGCIYGEQAENIRIFGNGILDDSHEERVGNYCYEPYSNGNMKFYECSNVTIEGVGMKNSCEWCLGVFGCTGVTMDAIKIFGQWRYNTDGIDCVNSQNISIKNSFVHSFDDAITIKGLDRYIHLDNRNIEVENCVLWCDWGKCCEIGIETACREYSNISFRNCDILRGGNTALDISNGDCAEIHDITFENIRVEYNVFDTPEIYQRREEMVYDAVSEISVPNLVLIRNTPFRTPRNCECYGMTPEVAPIDLTGIRSRNIHDVCIKNILVYYDEGVPLKDSKPDIKCIIKVDEGTDEFESICISDISVMYKGELV